MSYFHSQIEKVLKIWDPTLLESRKNTFRLNFAYPNICYWCFKHDGCVDENNETVKLKRCGKCKLIFYCGVLCRDKHVKEHKSFCKAVAMELKEIGLTCFAEKLQSLQESDRSYFKASLPIIMQHRLKKRLLYSYEIQMLQQQRVCMVCLEHDPAALNSCANCPHACFCKMHEQDEIHPAYCQLFTYSCIMDAYEAAFLNESWEYYMELIPHQTKSFSLPESMTEFVRIMFGTLKNYEDFKEFDLHVHLSENLFSRPLTLLFALDKLKHLPSVQMTVHVIGAKFVEEQYMEEWELILHCLRDLKELKIVLVGPELAIEQSSPNVCTLCASREKNLTVDSYIGEYKDFIRDCHFTKPHVIIGYELRIGTYNDSWPESIRAVVKVGSPFIITSSTGDKAHHDHSEMHHILNKTTEYFLFDKNPFVSLRPKVDNLDEKIYYSNQYITIYKNLTYDEGQIFECCELVEELEHICQNEAGNDKDPGTIEASTSNSDKSDQPDQIPKIKSKSKNKKKSKNSLK